MAKNSILGKLFENIFSMHLAEEATLKVFPFLNFKAVHSLFKINKNEVNLFQDRENEDR